MKREQLQQFLQSQYTRMYAETHHGSLEEYENLKRGYRLLDRNFATRLVEHVKEADKSLNKKV